MVLTAGFYRDSRAHNVRKVRVVKYMVVYGQVKIFLLKFYVRNHLHKPLVTNRLINYYMIYHSMIGVIHT